MLGESITITNHMPTSIEITTTQDKFVADADRTKKHLILPRETFTIFTDCVVSLHWEKREQVNGS